jgi:hypothetical protein
MAELHGFRLRKATPAGKLGSMKSGADGRHAHALWNVYGPGGRWVARIFPDHVGWAALPVIGREIQYGRPMTIPSHFTHRTDAFEAVVRHLTSKEEA